MYKKEDPQSIQEMFGSIAKQYDRTNAILSLQMHRLWNNALVKIATANHPTHLLDLCSGTGEIAFTYLKKSKTSKTVYMIDFCEQMLSSARLKGDHPQFKHHQLSYIEADAQKIPLESASIDSVTLAYGIRNIQNPLHCLNEVYRVLKPGGLFGILELTEPQNRFLKFSHQIYLKKILPLVGGWLTTNPLAYEYLCNSIQAFIKPDQLEEMLQSSGFSKTSQKKLGFGIATIISGKK